MTNEYLGANCLAIWIVKARLQRVRLGCLITFENV